MKRYNTHTQSIVIVPEMQGLRDSIPRTSVTRHDLIFEAWIGEDIVSRSAVLTPWRHTELIGPQTPFLVVKSSGNFRLILSGAQTGWTYITNRLLARHETDA